MFFITKLDEIVMVKAGVEWLGRGGVGEAATLGALFEQEDGLSKGHKLPAAL